MIHYICRDGQQDTIAPFLCTAGAALRTIVRVTPYEKIFAEGSIAAGHLIFADLDRLAGHELEAAQSIATAARAAVPGVRVLNEPARALQRYALLASLWQERINPFHAVRLDGPVSGLRYPVFIRREDGALGPESDLLHSERELRDAMAALLAAGRSLKGRLAVEYCAERSADGHFRKYGAFRVGDRILPQHIQFSRQWIVKQETGANSSELVAEELDYLRENPHRDGLRAVFDRASIAFGRIDYSFVEGRLVVFEINTNPMFPHGHRRNGRVHLRRMAGQALVAALRALDTPLPTADTVTVGVPAPAFRSLPAARAAPARSWQFVGRSGLLDRVIAFYWWAIPETLRRKLPLRLKANAGQVLNLFFANRAG